MEKEKKFEIKHNLIVYAICLVVAFLFLMVCSSNSFLYAFNDWVDYNWYMTMGQGILNGKVPYRDLFEQKGPIIYFMFAFCNLFSNSALAVFFMEVVSASLFLFLTFKLCRKYLNIHLSAVATIFTAFMTYSTILFVAGGGAVEEYILPFIVYFIYIFKEYLDGVSFSKIRCVFVGFILSVLFFIKFTLLLIPGVLLLAWLVLNLIKKKYKETFTSIALMFAGFFVPLLFVLIYFGANGAISDLIQCYFYNNLFLYTGQVSVLSNILSSAKSSILILLAVIVAVALIITLLVWLFVKKRRAFFFVLPLVLQVLMFLSIQNVYLYYFLILMPYLTYVFIGLLKLLDKFDIAKISQLVMPILVFGAMFGLTFAGSNNICELGREKEDFVQFQVAKDIADFKLENPTLLCYRMKDYGFYNVTGITPVSKYYAQNNFTEEAFPEMFESFDESIKQQKTDFVVLFKEDYVANKEFFDTYYKFENEYNYIHWEHNFQGFDLTFVLLSKI